MWVPIVSALAVGAGLWAIYDSHRKFTLEGQSVASQCGLTVEETSRFWSTGLRFNARAGPLEVRILSPVNKENGRQVTVFAPWPPDFFGISLRPEHEKPAEAREIEVGDELFDSAFYIVGPARLLFALLDADARRLLLTASGENAENGFQICGAELQVEVLYPEIARILSVLLEIARRFSQPLDIAERLAENSRRDPEPEVRLRNLLLLVRELPGEQATEALRAACADESSRVRLRAAQELGAEAHGLLLELAESAEDDSITAQAVSSLRRDLPLERTRAILSQALLQSRLQTARACVERLGDSVAAEDVETLAKVAADENNELAAAAAQALGATGSAAAEPPLLAALQHTQPDVRVAAAKALGRAGSAAAVLPLKEAAEGSRHKELLRAARQAIAEIQSRLQGASPGQLSLAQPEAGQLSLAAVEAGQLSLADDADGRLSLPPEALS